MRVLASSSAGNAYVLEDDGRTLLLDAGIRYPDLQKALWHRVTALDGCLVTHEHGDHAKAVPQLMRAGVDVYASAGTLDAIGASGHRARTVRDQQPIDVGPWRVLPLQAVHDAREPLSYLVAGPTGKCLYVTDTAFCPYRFQGLTHVLIEANFSDEILRRNVDNGSVDVHRAARTQRNHLSLARAIDLLRANDMSGVEGVWLLHMSNENGDADAFKAAVQVACARPTYIAEERATT
ncbi:MAG: MBL fold metallo-hydrolase [Gemmatimonadaceae bacterium]|nr:MBL fold metallo-hydrolase [Gemmatimonadaceae bacterium]